MSNHSEYIIPTKLSDYVDKLEDWELVEYASRYSVTSVYCLNGASRAYMKEVNRVWKLRYPEEDIPIIECYPPLVAMSCDDLSFYPDDTADEK